MHNLLFSIVCLLALGVVTSGTAAEDQCRTCHQALGDRASTLFQNDVHRAKGITCAGCHGGNDRTDDMEKAMSKQEGFLGVPKGDAVSERCASCHSDSTRMKSYGSQIPTHQWEDLNASAHGKLTTTGRQHIAQCTTCHDAHGIVRVSNSKSPVHPLNVVATCSRCHASAATMRTYNPSLAVDQLEKYRTSVHGILNERQDPKVATCASCHGSHSILPHTDAKSKVYALNIPATCATCHSNADYMKSYGIPTDQYDKFAHSVHGNALLVKKDVNAPACNDCHGNHGAIPPGVESISNVCGTCHALNANLFSTSPHKQAFDSMNLPECATCHENHDIVTPTNLMLGVTEEASCSRCHSQSEYTKGYAAAKEMRSLIDSLELTEERARVLVEEAEQKGMEVGEAKFTLRNVRQARLESRTVIHGFNLGRFTEVVNKGFSAASTVSQAGQEAIDEYYFRRIGLGISTAIITLLVVILFLYIKRLDRLPRTSGQMQGKTKP